MPHSLPSMRTAFHEDAEALLKRLGYEPEFPALEAQVARPSRAHERRRLMATLKATLHLLKRDAELHAKLLPPAPVADPAEENRQLRLDAETKERIRRQTLETVKAGHGTMKLAEITRETRSALPFRCGKSHVPTALGELLAAGAVVRIGRGRNSAYGLAGGAGKAV